MKNRLQSYLSFTRTERLGVIALTVILLGLIIVRATMHLWVKPEDNSAKEKELSAAWVAFKNNSSKQPNIATTESSIGATQGIPVKTDSYPQRKSYSDTAYHTYQATTVHAHLFSFNPNTLDSAGFIKLGLKPKTTAILLHWRAKGKVFRRKEELKKVYTLTPEDYQRLEPYILLP